MIVNSPEDRNLQSNSSNGSWFDQVGPYFIIPNTFGGPDMPNSAYRVGTYLSRFANNKTKTVEVWPSYKDIQKGTGLCFETISKAIKWLEEHGHIKRRKRFNGSTIYTLLYRLPITDSGSLDGEVLKEETLDSVNISSSIRDNRSPVLGFTEPNYTNELNEIKNKKEEEPPPVVMVSESIVIQKMDVSEPVAEAPVVITQAEVATKQAVEAPPVVTPPVTNPAVNSYIKIFGITPNPMQRAEIINTIPNTEIEKWEKNLRYWALRDWNKRNIPDLIDFHRKGGESKPYPGNKPASASGKRVTRREQLPEYTQSQREAAQEAARKRIAEREVRRRIEAATAGFSNA